MTSRRQLLLAAASLLAVAGCGASARPDPHSPEAPVPQPFPYGEDAIQVADLYLPAEPQGAPVVVLVHGGFWSSAYDRSLEVDVAADLVAAGYAVWNLDYRSIGNGGGSPPRSRTSRQGSTRSSTPPRRPAWTSSGSPWSGTPPAATSRCGPRAGPGSRPTRRAPGHGWCPPRW